MRRVCLHGTFRVTQPYGLRVLYLRMHHGLRNDQTKYFTGVTMFSHHAYHTTISKYAMENDNLLVLLNQKIEGDSQRGEIW